MKLFFQAHLDLIFFVYGLAFLLLAAVCVPLQKKRQVNIPWFWLGLFGLTHGCNEWLDLLSISLGDSESFKWARLIVMTVSFIFLIEFGRAACEKLDRFKAGLWIYLPLLLGAAYGYVLGAAGLNGSCRFALGFLGSVYSALALWEISRREKSGSQALRVGAAVFLIYGLAGGLVPPKSLFGLAGIINHDSFLAWAGFPIQLVRGLLAVVIAFAIWYYSEANEKRVGNLKEMGVNKLSVVLAAGVIVTICLGEFGADWMGDQQQARYKERMLTDIQQIAVSIDSLKVKKLSGTAADVNDPVYQQFKLLLQTLRQNYSGSRFIYLTRLVKGQVIFLADSEPAGSPDESPPGQVYDEATPEFKRIFSQGGAFIEGPYTDRWGAWISAITVISDAQTGEVIASLAMDVSAQAYQQAIAKQRLKAILLMAAFCLVFLLTFIYNQRLTRSIYMMQEGLAADLLLAWGPGIIVMVLGLAIGFFIFQQARENSFETFQALFRQRAAARIIGVSQAMKLQIERLDHISRFMENSANVGREDFRRFVVPLTEDSVIQAIGWAPRVTGAQRPDFENRAKQDGFPAFQFQEKNAAGDLISAADRREYFPIYYTEPVKGNETASGFDLGSESARREALEKSRDENRPIATRQITLVLVQQKKIGFLIFVPVYVNQTEPRTVAERRELLRGFVTGVYPTEEFLKNAYSKMPAEGLACLIEDPAAPLAERVLYRHQLRLGTVDWNNIATKYEAPLEIADREWRITIVPGTTFIAEHLPTGYRWILPISFFLTGIFALFLNGMVTRRYRAEALVAERTKELSLEHDRLLKAKEAAEASNVAKSQFLANMSHEIRTPMNAIIGFSQLLKTAELPAKQKNYIDMINTSGEHLLKIIDDILDISKMEAGRVQLESIEFDLPYLVTNVFKMIAVRLKSSQVYPYVDISPDVPARVKGDPTRLRQVLVNLLGNAGKFTHAGGIGLIVDIDLRIPADAGLTRVRFAVKDTGIGIPADKLEAIFFPFTQADGSTTRRYGGTGLGLTIVKSFVEAMGGTIQVKSQEGKGAEFIFDIPFIKVSGEIEPRLVPVKPEALPGKKVFILEDNEIARQITRQHCEKAGMRVVAAESALAGAWQALERLIGEGNCPDVLLFDFLIGKEDCLQLLKKVREDQRFGQSKMVAVTAEPRVGDRETAAQLGFDGYLSKPFMAGDLIQVIAAVLGDRRAAKTVVTKHLAQEVSCKGVRVLLVEDSMANVELMKEYLNILGCIADYVFDGRQAIEQIKLKGYDLCLMDVHMPEMDGVEATKIIRAQISQDIPIIALTAAVLQEEQAAAVQAGMNACLAKPVQFSALREVIMKYGLKAV
ncbi:MAG: CHASE domain-containing protein [Candidatus Omnitrophica bacterium]|nr:CHASE domain-containing protein [Candidatus Omnitrophota bacterium]